MADRMDEWPALLDFAVELAEAAGPTALRYFRAPLEVHNKLSAGGFDPVTRADREVEAFIREATEPLMAAPGHRVPQRPATPRLPRSCPRRPPRGTRSARTDAG